MRNLHGSFLRVLASVYSDKVSSAGIFEADSAGNLPIHSATDVYDEEDFKEIITYLKGR